MRVEGGPQSITSQISIRVGGAKRETSSWSLGWKVCGLVGLLGPDRRDSDEVGGVGMLGGEGTSGAKVLGKREARARGKGRKDNYECLKLGKCGGLGGGRVS
jgi:hypothetical protein